MFPIPGKADRMAARNGIFWWIGSRTARACATDAGGTGADSGYGGCQEASEGAGLMSFSFMAIVQEVEREQRLPHFIQLGQRLFDGVPGGAVALPDGGLEIVEAPEAPALHAFDGVLDARADGSVHAPRQGAGGFDRVAEGGAHQHRQQ